jgi:hypothetical protein
VGLCPQKYELGSRTLSAYSRFTPGGCYRRAHRPTQKEKCPRLDQSHRTPAEQPSPERLLNIAHYCFILTRIGVLTPCNYGVLPSRSTVKLGKTFVKGLVWIPIGIVAVAGISIGAAFVLHRKYSVAEKQWVIAEAANASTTEGPLHLEFRGLHAGQTRAEVEAVLRKLGENPVLECNKPKNRYSSCHSANISADPDMVSVGFSSEDRLVDFHWTLNSHSGANSDALRQELATANHKQGTPSSSVSGEFCKGADLEHRSNRCVPHGSKEGRVPRRGDHHG